MAKVAQGKVVSVDDRKYRQGDDAPEPKKATKTVVKKAVKTNTEGAE